MPPSKFEPFNRVDFTFKTIHEHAIKASVLVPKHLQAKPREGYPTIVNWHGGGFVVGDRLYEGWLPGWLLEICLTNSAILIAPDYRLLPEASATEMLDDVRDFWYWVHDTLPTLITTWDAFPDLTRLACTGQSAGGYLAVQSALLFAELSRIKVVVSMGGSINTNIPQNRVPGPRVILGKRPPPPGKAESIIRAYLRNIKPKTVRTSGDVMEMWDFLTCVLQQAYLSRWLTAEGKEELDVMKVLEKTKSMPPSFVDQLKKILPDVPVLLNLRPGDHGFEAMGDKTSGKEIWIQDGIDFMKTYWL
ncbi:hypothetical protein N0V90_001784 [Kalmusia sp. IMI 367209]|nr:hypothetical protein N0V90_001784 [Kalmusia sp. IMI 367209]